MTTILTTAQMRLLEQMAIGRGVATGLDLMERAGAGVVAAVLAEWPGIEADIDDDAPRAVVLCGPGNNGGDGFVVARLLRERGWAVEVLALAGPDALAPDARTASRRWALSGGRSRPLSEDLLRAEGGADLYVDALFGIGLSRPVGGVAGAALRHLAGLDGDRKGRRGRIVSIDVPSGLDADTGQARGPSGGEALRAGLTVTFDSPKPGHLVGSGPALCGRLRVVDIGLGRLREGWACEASQDGGILPRLALVEPSESLGPGAVRVGALGKAQGHKYDHGHAVILGGGPGRGGAARMAARGALRVGAGLVTLAVPPSALQENAAALDAIMLRSVRDGESLAALLADDRHNALGAGPGLGLGEGQGRLVAALLGVRRPTVLDADALTLVSKDDALRAALHEAVVLTPHEGEFGRLFPGIDERWRASRLSKVDAAREAARDAGCVVLLKGPDTVIAEPSGGAAISAAVYDRTAPWLATAGSGDVLAGFILGLLARGLQPFDAACTGAWLHVECARSFGPGLVAEDLPEELPRVFRALGL